MDAMLSYFVWDPSPGMFDYPLPLLNRPILWYGFFFALGFFLAYWVLLSLLRTTFPRERASKFAEQITLYVIFGAVIGARLGDVLFYQEWSSWLHHPLSIIAVWEGGLASHGGAIGILIALFLLSKKCKMPFLRIVDFVVIPTALAAVFIRIGNFFNQEILGTATQLPWGVLFLHPADGSPLVPRHPVQLYEAFGYLCLFVLLWGMRRSRLFAKRGKLTGLFLVLLFSFRFLIEFLKTEQSAWWSHTPLPLTMGQLLSFPFIALGVFFLWREFKQ